MENPKKYALYNLEAHTHVPFSLTLCEKQKKVAPPEIGEGPVAGGGFILLISGLSLRPVGSASDRKTVVESPIGPTGSTPLSKATFVALKRHAEK